VTEHLRSPTYLSPEDLMLVLKSPKRDHVVVQCPHCQDFLNVHFQSLEKWHEVKRTDGPKS